MCRFNLTVLFLSIFQLSLSVAATEKKLLFSDVWIRQSDVELGIKTIPTGTDLIYTYRSGTTAAKTIRMNFYWAGSCSTSSSGDGYFDLSGTFTAGETWYLSGSGLSNYVKNTSIFWLGGSIGGGRISDYFNIRDSTAGSEGTCTTPEGSPHP